jgi:hypothetical protein
MENSITTEQLKNILQPDLSNTFNLAMAVERQAEMDSTMYETPYNFEEEHPQKLRLYWLYKACLGNLVQERDLIIDQDNLKGAIARHKILSYLEKDVRLSSDMKQTLIKIVKSNDVVGLRAVLEILGVMEM